MLYIINLIVIVFVGVFLFLFLRSETARRRLEEERALREFGEQVRGTIEKTSETTRGELQNLQSEFSKHMRHQSDVLQTTNTELNKRMDKAATVIGEVQKELGKMSTVATSIDELQNILKAPKLRGGFGELLLDNLLAQILPKEHYESQYRFKNGEIVDAIIYLGDRIVPIDSKFPLENFNRVIEMGEDTVSKQARRQFINDVKKHIQAVAKYIRMDERTYDFALMYIPAENVYYEIAVKEDVGGEGRELMNYALKLRVIPVSPNTLYAYLMTIIAGLKGMQVERHAQAILDKMGRVQKDFAAFGDVFRKVGFHLENARKSFDDADKRVIKIDDRLHEFVPQLEEKSTVAAELPTPVISDQ